MGSGGRSFAKILRAYNRVMRMYGLVDCNNFFVSCERLFRPDLLNKPTIVAGVNDGVVVARSEEAKALGIPMGVPFFQIKDLVQKHKVNVLSVNFELYRDISERVMKVMKEEMDDVYQYSIDEAFFEFEADNIEEAREKLFRLKAVIEQKVGVPVSVGAGKTMTIAKFASEKEKRASGVCVLVGDTWTSVTKDIMLGSIWGIGGKTTQKLRGHDLLTVADFLAVSTSFIAREFGVHGSRLYSELSEVPAHHPDEHSGLQKSIMSTRSFAKTTNSLSDIESAITYHIERATAELRDIKGKAGVVRVMIEAGRHSDWFLQGGRQEVHFNIHTNDTRTILSEALRLVRELYRKEVPYKKAGIVLSHIIGEEETPLSLWGNDNDDGLMGVVDSLNKKLGKDALTFGRLKGGGQLDKDKFRSPRYTTRWNEVRLVSVR